MNLATAGLHTVTLEHQISIYRLLYPNSTYDRDQPFQKLKCQRRLFGNYYKVYKLQKLIEWLGNL